GPLAAVAEQIARGDAFQVSVLASQLPAVEPAESSSYCRPTALRSAAVIRLRLADLAVATGDSGLTDAAAGPARRSIRDALACSPADPYLWLGLHWAENLQNAQHAGLRYLGMSYRPCASERLV